MLRTFILSCNQSPERFSSWLTEALYLRNTNPHSPLPPAPGSHHSTFCLYECYKSSCLTKVVSHRICLTIALYVYSTFSLFIHLLGDTWVASTFWILGIMLPWTGSTCISCKPCFLILLCVPRVELLGHMVILFSNFWGTTILFCTVAASFCIPTNNVQGFPLLHALINSKNISTF